MLSSLPGNGPPGWASVLLVLHVHCDFQCAFINSVVPAPSGNNVVIPAVPAHSIHSAGPEPRLALEYHQCLGTAVRELLSKCFSCASISGIRTFKIFVLVKRKFPNRYFVSHLYLLRPPCGHYHRRAGVHCFNC